MTERLDRLFVKTAPDETIATRLEDETVVLDLASGTYFGLRFSAIRIWELAQERRSVASIVDTLLDEYDVTREELEQDLLQHLVQLARHGLIALSREPDA